MMNHRETALLLAFSAFLVSFLYKFVIKDMSLTYMGRDIIMFIAVYFVTKTVFHFIDRIILSYRKIM